MDAGPSRRIRGRCGSPDIGITRTAATSGLKAAGAADARGGHAPLRVLRCGALRPLMRRIVLLSTGLAGAVALATALLAAQPPQAGPRIEVSFARSAHSDALTGRVYVAISRTNDRSPINQTDPTGVPLFAQNVEALPPGQAVTFGGEAVGYPVAALRNLPAGDYWMEPFVNIYTRFAREDGHVVWLHMDQWEGQNWKRSPGNLYGPPVQVHFDPHSTAAIALVADHVIPPVQVPADTAAVQ